MKIEHLRYFAEACESGSVSAAASRLFISQQGLNKALTRMESELGCTLLNRSYAGVALTEKGEIFYEYAKHALEEYDAVTRVIGANPSLEAQVSRRVVDVGVTPYCLGVLYEELTHPCVNSAHEMPFDEVVAGLGEGSVEFAFLDAFNERREDLHGLFGLDPADFSVEPVFNTALGILCKVGSALGEMESVSVEELLTTRIALILDETLRSAFKRIAGGRSFQSIALETTNRSAFLAHVNDGKTPALLDSLAFWELQQSKAIDEDVVYIPLQTHLIDTICLAYRRGSAHELLFKRYAAFVKKTFDSKHASYSERFSWLV